MKTTFQLNISNPCAEQWDKFTPTSNGGFCSSCQKNVIDFTNMSDSQVVAYFRDLANEKQHLCGRFRSDQLGNGYEIEEWFPKWYIKEDRLSYEVPVSQIRQHISLPGIQKRKTVRNLAVAVLTFMSISYGYGQQQLKGQVTDSDGMPLPGVNIIVKGTTRGVASDTEGKYALVVDKNDTLVYSFIGFLHTELKASEIKPVIAMKEDVMELSEIVVVGYGSTNCTTITMGMTTTGYYKEENHIVENFIKDNASKETNFRKFKTQLRVLGNPVVTDEATIIPIVDENTTFTSSEEKNLAESWYIQNGFQYIENVQVYDVAGRTFETTYTKINNGKVVVNLNGVPSGVCIIRVTYSNEQSLNDIESSAVRILVQR